ncbi:MAG TPA: copper-binding protein, partial [Burkholderiales bacterium]|nr:copper-binding protein [Burkholderiales bacterium]
SKESAGGHDMEDMPGKTMPGTDSKTAEAATSKEDAGGHEMGSMKDMPDEPMPDMHKKAATAPKSKKGAGGHNMHSMKDMPGMDKKAATTPKSKKGAGGHHMDSMKDVPGKTMPGMDSKTADAPISKDGHGEMAMAKPQTASGQSAKAQTAGVTGTGIVQDIDKANGKVKLTHDQIAALGWPKMTMFFRLKDSTLADQVKKGDNVEFSLEKSASGYVISRFRKGAAGHDMKQMKK